MPPFLHFYGGMTPTAFRALSLDDYHALDSYRLAVLRHREAQHGPEDRD